MRWKRYHTNLLVAEPIPDYVYLVERRPKPNDCYWSATVQPLDNERVTLGVLFLSRFEAIEVCEAWEYGRNSPDQISSGGNDEKRSGIPRLSSDDPDDSSGS
jgi:hypothetical protein